jgi:Trk K+ transport system NAD-binding subunit
LVVLITLGREGFRRRTAFFTGISIAQISEFSLILVFLGRKDGILSQSVVDSITLATVITIAISSYGLVFGTKLYKKVEKYLRIFESKEKVMEVVEEKELEDHIVLIGAGRLGWEILKQLQKQKEKILVVDFNPTMVNLLKEEGVDCLFGDITDPDIFERTRLDKAKLVISTVFDPEDTEELLEQISSLNRKPIVFVTAAERHWALKFYRLGASYVIIPRILSGHQVAHLLTNQKLTEIREGQLKKEHLEELREELSKVAL